MELVPGGSAIETLSRAAPATDAASMLGARSVRLRGEIVDFKCYLGAMKPGDGKTHKACAALCISNGIPPMLITRNERGDLEYVLLEDADGASVSDRVAPFAGEPIEVEGALHSIGSLKVLRLSRDSPRLVQWR
jgi:hypothetical protein